MSGERRKKSKPLTNSCFKPSRFSFNLALRESTSRLSAADCARMVAVSARERVVISVRISDSAARKRYACCRAQGKKKNQNKTTRAGSNAVHTLSRSLYVSPSRLTFPTRSTSRARVARMRLRAVCLGNVFSSSLKKAWVLKGGFW